MSDDMWPWEEMPLTAPDTKPKERTPVMDPVIKMLGYFAYEHLPVELQGVSKQVHMLAHEIHSILPPGAEKTAGYRKLLEAKDCFVRALLDK